MKLLPVVVITGLGSILSLTAIAASVPSESSLVNRYQCPPFPCNDDLPPCPGEDCFCIPGVQRCGGGSIYDLNEGAHAGRPVGLGALVEAVEIRFLQAV